MDLLFVVPYAPTPIRTRPYNLLRQLVQRGHKLTLATVWTNAEERGALAQTAKMGIRVIAMPLSTVRALWNCAKALPRSVPLQAMYCWQPELAQKISQVVDLTHFDLIHVEHLRGAEYGLHLMLRKTGVNPRPPLLWDSVDCISSLFEQAAAHSGSRFSRWMALFELPRTRRYEAWLVQRFNRTLVVSKAEQNAFDQLLRKSRDEQVRDVPPYGSGTASKITMLRNGVDLSFFAPFKGERAPRTIVMTGKMSYHANIAAAQFLLDEIMPRVWAEMPDAKVEIVGQNPATSLTRLARKSGGRVRITGSVPDLRPFLEHATMAVAPMVYSAGIQNKLLEALASATPVVATPNALAGLSVQPERDVLAGEDAEIFSRQILRLGRDEMLQRELGRNGRRYVESNHDWRQVANELESVYYELIQAFSKHV
jgi:glycosyltransferase involved in cell wall biosynthesis